MTITQEPLDIVQTCYLARGEISLPGMSNICLLMNEAHSDVEIGVIYWHHPGASLSERDVWVEVNERHS